MSTEQQVCICFANISLCRTQHFHCHSDDFKNVSWACSINSFFKFVCYFRIFVKFKVAKIFSYIFCWKLHSFISSMLVSATHQVTFYRLCEAKVKVLSDGLVFVFYVWPSNFPSTFCCKDYSFPVELSWHQYWRPIDI